MQIVSTFVLPILLSCSFLGYMLFIKQIFKLRNEFIPLFVFSGVACSVYFCGLMGLLLHGSIVILTAGFMLFIILVIKQYKTRRTFKISPSFFSLGWTVGCICFFTLLLRSRLTHYDNFSHWAIIVKQMLSTNAFPTASSTLIDFKNYPLGISSFIYYICRFVGRWEQIMIFAQGVLIFSCFYTIFGIITERKRFLLYAFLGLGCTTLSLFNITIRINNLLVDFLLPILTLAIFAIAYIYRAEPKRALITALPPTALLTITKSTGIIFAAIGLIFLLHTIFVHRNKISIRKIALISLITLLLVMLAYFSWSWHMNTSFLHVENKFDLQQMPTAKTSEQIAEITGLFLRTSTDLSTRPALGILVFNLLALGVIIADKVLFKKGWMFWKVLIALDIVLLLYYAGILGLYIYSMPWDEALWLAGFERYASSIVILFAGGLVLTATIKLENSFYYKIGDVPDEKAFRSIRTKNQYQKAVLACIAVSITLLLSEYNGMLYTMREYSTSLPNKIEQITGDRWYLDGVEDSKRYLFYASDENAQVTNFYMQYIGRYYLYAPHVDGICLFYEDNMDNLLSSYDYLIMVQSDNDARTLLNKHYGIDGREGIYRIENTEEDILLYLE